MNWEFHERQNVELIVSTFFFFSITKVRNYYLIKTLAHVSNVADVLFRTVLKLGLHVTKVQYRETCVM